MRKVVPKDRRGSGRRRWRGRERKLLWLPGREEAHKLWEEVLALRAKSTPATRKKNMLALRCKSPLAVVLGKKDRLTSLPQVRKRRTVMLVVLRTEAVGCAAEAEDIDFAAETEGSGCAAEVEGDGCPEEPAVASTEEEGVDCLEYKARADSAPHGQKGE